MPNPEKESQPAIRIFLSGEVRRKREDKPDRSYQRKSDGKVKNATNPSVPAVSTVSPCTCCAGCGAVGEAPSALTHTLHSRCMG